jgi:hypothetical protein
MNRRIRRVAPALGFALGFMVWLAALVSARASGGAPEARRSAPAPKLAQATSSDTAELRLSGTWALAKTQSLRVAYAYVHMTSSDWIYEGMQTGIGALSGVLPSNEQAFRYSVNAFALSYLVSF